MTNKVGITVEAYDGGASDELLGVGDAAKKASKEVVTSMGTTEAAFDTAARGSSKFGAALDSAEGFTGQLADGVDGVAQATDAISGIMSHAADKAEKLARAQQDVEQAASDAAQAVEDMNQANRDSAQAGIDAEQASLDLSKAILDQTNAEKAYDDAVKKHGANSAEAESALNDITQAIIDQKQAKEDGAQAERDSAQAQLDSKQAMIDQKGAATDLTAAQRDLANQSSVMGQISDWAGILSGVLGGLAGIIGTVTAVQWAWNVAMTANPIGLVIAAIAVLIGIVVLIATKTDWFQKLWHAIWGKIGDPVKAAWAWIKNATTQLALFLINVWRTLPQRIGSAFKSMANIILFPFKAAFNSIAWLWNNTVGQIHFSVPGWVPGIGGNSFGVPHIPMLAAGGDVLKSGLAMIHRGERIVPTAQAQRLSGAQPPQGAGMSAEDFAAALLAVLGNLKLELSTERSGNKLMDAILEGIRAYVSGRGGNVQTALGKGRG